MLYISNIFRKKIEFFNYKYLLSVRIIIFTFLFYNNSISQNLTSSSLQRGNPFSNQYTIYNEKGSQSYIPQGTDKDSVKAKNPDITVLIGNQFYDNEQKTFYPVIGVSVYPYSAEYLKVPFEFLLYKIRRNNKEIFFPRISSAVKYYPNLLNFNNIYFQGGVGIPLFFYYPLDFNISLGLNFHNIQIEIREIYYLEVGGQAEITFRHWPMFSILLGITL